MRVICSGIFLDWGNDADFEAEYQHVRNYIVDHDRAHAQNDPARGDRVNDVEQLCKLS